MSTRTAIAHILIAALLVGAAGPASAKKQGADAAAAAQAQQQQQANKKAKRQAGKDCFFTAPPFMRNPRFMNRGFFKKKCPGQDP